MKKTETLFICCAMVFALAIGFRASNLVSRANPVGTLGDTKYGSFLAAQHAIYVNDFDAASKYTADLNDVDVSVVKNTKTIAEFLSGRMPDNAADLAKESGMSARLIYDAHLIEQGDWKALYSRHKKDSSPLIAPLRVFSSVAINHRTEAINFVNSLQTNESWKAFIRGQIFVESGNIEKAAAEFANVSVDFMNINDYLYLMSFYHHNGFVEDEEILRQDFTSRPGGMFMLEYDNIPDWSRFSGIKNALAFSLIQNVSHTHVMMYSDLSILLLRFAKIISQENGNDDAIDYYTGQYFFSNNGDYNAYFSQIDSSSPFYLFATLRDCEISGNMSKLHRLLRAHPLFVPAMNKLTWYYVANGDKQAALRILNRAMENEELTDASHAFLLKNRANVYFSFGDMDNAQSDLHAAADILMVDADILALQAKIWAAQNREIDTAYDYAMTLVQRNPSDVFAWDVLGRVVAAREGDAAALELIERVGEVAKECSALFDFLGDLYARTGMAERARDAYMRAIDLSDDGLVVVPQIERKIRKLK